MEEPFLPRDLAWAEFKALGEVTVQDALLGKKYGLKKAALAQQWLNEQKEARAESRVDAKDRRDEDLARQGLDVARSATKAAWTSNVISVIALIVAIVALVFSLR
jgi:hypothetical protein